MLESYHLLLFGVGLYCLKAGIIDRQAPLLTFAAALSSFLVAAAVAVAGINPLFAPTETVTSLPLAGVAFAGGFVALVYLVLEWREDAPDTSRAENMVLPPERNRGRSDRDPGSTSRFR